MGIPRFAGKCSAKMGRVSRRLPKTWRNPACALLSLLAAVPVAPAGGESNPIAAENARPGSPGWELVNPALAHEIEGYAGATSLAPGDTLPLHVSSFSPQFTAEVFRMGWYGGTGARRVLEVRGITGGRRRIPEPREEDGLIECDWPVSCRVAVSPEWTTGVYLVRLTGSREAKQAFVPFVVREREGIRIPPHRRGPGAARGVAPATRPHRAPFLFSCAVNTWQAYNSWGGKSLYDFNSFGGRALRVSFDRPYGSNAAAKRGAGAGEFLTVDHAPLSGGWEYPFLRWLERNGTDVAYATNLDMHRDRNLSLGRRAILIAGHDEYWSRAMRDHVEMARDRGVNLGIFASNVCYWQVRVEPSTSGAEGRILFCGKEPDRDPVYNTAGDRDLTVRFRNLNPPRPELSLIGVMMSAEDVQGDFTPLPEARGHWVFRGTGIASGRTRAIPGLLGYEVDRGAVGDRTFGRWSPRGLTVLARAWVQPPKGNRIATETTIYTAPSRAIVFAAGTMQWSWGLDDWGAPGLHRALRNPDIEGITRNVLERFLGTARAPGPRFPG